MLVHRIVTLRIKLISTQLFAVRVKCLVQVHNVPGQGSNQDYSQDERTNHEATLTLI